MKKIVVVALSLVFLVGCAAKQTTVVTPPIPGCRLTTTGTCDQLDVTSYRVLADAKKLLTDIGNSVTSGKLTLTATQKTLYNNLATASNIANASWEVYHAGGSNGTELQTNTNNLSSAISTATNQITVTK